MSPVTAFPFGLMNSGSTEMLLASWSVPVCQLAKGAPGYARRCSYATANASSIQVVVIGGYTGQPR